MIATGEGGYIGRYWLNPVPVHMEGHHKAAWPTRREARAELSRVRGAFPKATVVRVTVCVEPTDG